MSCVIGIINFYFFTSTEISELMSLLAVIDNPHQDIPLIAALRSAAFGFTAEDLATAFFTGVFGAELVKGSSVQKAAIKAHRAAMLCMAKVGTYASFPTIQQLKVL